MSMSPEARERHRKRALRKRAKEARPQPFKLPPDKKVADWIPVALAAFWAFVFSPWKYPALEKINNLFRTKSSERRIAIAKVLQVMVYYKDTLTLWVAYPSPKKDGEFIGRGVDFLVRETGLTKAAVKGALKDLCDAKLIETYRRRARLADGGMGYGCAIRLMRRELFDVFELTHRMTEARKEAANKVIDQLTPIIETGRSITRGWLSRFKVAQNILLDAALEVTPTSAPLPS